MPRKKKPVKDMRLVPLSEFEQSVQRVLKSPKAVVDEKMAEFHASNKQRRELRKPKA